jgi:hypothetical protein
MQHESRVVAEFKDILGNEITLSLDHFEDPDEVQRNICDICKLLYRQAVKVIRLQKDRDSWMEDDTDVQSNGCGHSFCRECLVSAVEAQPSRRSCPSCRLEITKGVGRVIKAADVRRSVANLRAKCIYSDDSSKGTDSKMCSWVGELGINYKSYLSHIESCPCRGKLCETCDEVIPWSSAHLCPNQMVVCHEACSGDSKSEAKAAGRIGCERKLKRKDMSKHLEICENRPVTCWYGCKGKFSVKSIDDHNKSEVEKHLSMYEKKTLMDKVSTTLKIQMLETEVKDLKDTNDQLESKTKLFEETIDKYKNTKVNFSCALGVFHIDEWELTSQRTFLCACPDSDVYLKGCNISIEVFNYVANANTGTTIAEEQYTEFKVHINYEADLKENIEMLLTLSILNHKLDSHDLDDNVVLEAGRKSFTVRFVIPSSIIEQMLCEEGILTFALCNC